MLEEGELEALVVEPEGAGEVLSMSCCAILLQMAGAYLIYVCLVRSAHINIVCAIEQGPRVVGRAVGAFAAEQQMEHS